MGRFPLDPYPYGWFHAAFSADLGPGDVVPLRGHGEDYVLWRDAGGAPHLLEAFCAHLGAHLGHGGEVIDGTIRCPFHAWQYDGAGRCVNIPYSHKTHKLGNLASYPLVERNGMIWRWWHPEGAPPSFDVPELAEWGSAEWTDDYVRHCWRIGTQWREVAENGIDLTHFHYLHGIATIPELDYACTEGEVWHSISRHVVNTPLGQRPSAFEIRFHGPGYAWLRFTIDDVAEILFLVSITPIDETTIENRFSFLARRAEGERGQQMVEALIAEVIGQVTDDVPIWENKIVKDPPRLAAGDGPIMRFRRWAHQFSSPALLAGATASAGRSDPGP